MAKDKDYNPRDILKALKKPRDTTTIYEWRVQIHKPVDEILQMIRDRSDPNFKQPTPIPYTVTANFITIEEAVEYAYMVRLRGLRCGIYNNWTGQDYEEK